MDSRVRRFWNNEHGGIRVCDAVHRGVPLFYHHPDGVSLYFSFTKYNMLKSPVFIGARNYIRLFTDDARFAKSIGVTFYYVVVSVFLKLTFALLVAVLLTRKEKLLGFYRSVYYLPSLVGEAFPSRWYGSNYLRRKDSSTIFASRWDLSVFLGSAIRNLPFGR